MAGALETKLWVNSLEMIPRILITHDRLKCECLIMGCRADTNLNGLERDLEVVLECLTLSDASQDSLKCVVKNFLLFWLDGIKLNQCVSLN